MKTSTFARIIKDIEDKLEGSSYDIRVCVATDEFVQGPWAYLTRTEKPDDVIVIQESEGGASLYVPIDKILWMYAL